MEMDGPQMKSSAIRFDLEPEKIREAVQELIIKMLKDDLIQYTIEVRPGKDDKPDFVYASLGWAE